MSREDTRRNAKKNTTKTDEKRWARIVAYIEERLNRPSYNTWVRVCRLGAMDRTSLRVLAPSDVHVAWLSEYYTALFTQAFAGVWGHMPNELVFERDTEGTDEQPIEAPPDTATPTASRTRSAAAPAALCADERATPPAVTALLGGIGSTRRV